MTTTTVDFATARQAAGFYTDEILAAEAAPLVAWCDARSGQVGIREIKRLTRMFRDFGNHPDYGKPGTKFADGVSGYDIWALARNWDRTQSPEAQARTAASILAEIRAANQRRRERIRKARDRNDRLLIDKANRDERERHSAAVAYANSCPCDEPGGHEREDAWRLREFSGCGSLAERRYARDVHAELAWSANQYYRDRMTPEKFLADPTLRRKALAAVRAGKKYSAELIDRAPRAIVVEAVRRMAERLTRRAAAAIVDPLTDPQRLRKALALRKSDRAKAEREKILRRLWRGRLSRKAVAALLPDFLNTVSDDADAMIRQVVRLVGTIGDQAEDDLSRLETGESFTGKKGRNHRLERYTLDRVQHLPDWSAVLLTMRTYRSFGSNGSGEYSSVGGSSFETILIVRDTTTGEAHLLTVPPKFGNPDTDFFGSFNDSGWRQQSAKLRTKHSPTARKPGNAAALKRLKQLDRMPADQRRIWAAVAWTFSLDVAEYAPQRQA